MDKIDRSSAARAPRLSEILTLRNSPIFSDLPEEAVRDTLIGCAVRSYAKGLPIFNEGEPATHIFLVLAGDASVNVCDARGRWWRVHTAGPGDLLGVNAVISGGPYRLSSRIRISFNVEGLALRRFFRIPAPVPSGLLSRSRVFEQRSHGSLQLLGVLWPAALILLR